MKFLETLSTIIFILGGIAFISFVCMFMYVMYIFHEINVNIQAKHQIEEKIEIVCDDPEWHEGQDGWIELRQSVK